MRAQSIPSVLVVVAIGGGCNLIIGIERDYELGAGGATTSASSRGGGHTGGTAPSSTTSSTTGTTSSTTGTTSSTTGTTSSVTGTTSSTSTSGCPSMVDLGAFCIDATEVTNAAYGAWLATGPSIAAQPSSCAWNVDFSPTAGWPAAASKASEPVVYVDWCDAFAYCAAAGKRLCGHLAGGSVGYAGGFADPAESAWMAACSQAGAGAYPYGDTYVPGACDGKDYTHPNQAIAVGSASVCHGPSAPYTAIADMSGNVAEWEDACAGATSASDLCRLRGGSFKDGSAALRCDAAASAARDTTGATIGFRCCGG
jgi:formylglycine-generating enzyme required for sulfatase activity